METIDRYVNRRKQAEASGEHGLAAEFDTIIADETNHRDELRGRCSHDGRSGNLKFTISNCKL